MRRGLLEDRLTPADLADVPIDHLAGRRKTGRRPAKIVAGYPPSLEKVVLAALERSPAQPSPPAAQLRDWLEEFAAQPDQRSNTAALAQWLRELFPVGIDTELNLPPVKIHCSVLAEDAIKSAIADYKAKRQKQQDQ